jgi:hypothetical protein
MFQRKSIFWFVVACAAVSLGFTGGNKGTEFLQQWGIISPQSLSDSPIATARLCSSQLSAPKSNPVHAATSHVLHSLDFEWRTANFPSDSQLHLARRADCLSDRAPPIPVISSRT